MNEFYNEAIEKLNKKPDGLGAKASAMYSAVMSALRNFCEQDGEFSQAVVQGGSVKDCMEKVAKGVGSSISDLEAFKRAVSFFFPGKTVRFSMDIVDECDLQSTAEKNITVTEGGATKKSSLSFSLDDFI